MKLTTPTRRSNVNLIPAAGVAHASTKSGMGIQLSGGVITSSAGEDSGSVIDSIKAGKRITISLGVINPVKYQVMMECHPALHAMGQVGFSRIIEPGDIVNLELHILANKAIDISALPWTVRLYMID